MTIYKKILIRIARYFINKDRTEHSVGNTRKGGVRLMFVGKRLAVIQQKWLHENRIPGEK